MQLEGRVALVTGGGEGIGRGIVRKYVEEGAQVVLADVNAELGARTAAELGAEFVHCDVRTQAADAVAATVERFGTIDVLVNNAWGGGELSRVENKTRDGFEHAFGVGFFGPYDAMRAAFPVMRAKGWGRVISTASAHSLVASPFKSAYVAAKHGVAGLTKTAALEVARDGITVNCISPGYVWTPLVQNQIPDTMKARNMTREQVIDEVLLAVTPNKQFVQPEQIGAFVVFLCSDAAQSITGANLSMDGGWTAA